MQLKGKTTPTLLALTAVSNYSNTAVVQHYAGMHLGKAIKATTPSIGLLTKNPNGDALVKLCVKNMLIGTSMYFNKVLTERQAMVIAEELLADYNYRQLRLEDILAICYEIKEADIFNLTPARILKQIKDYYTRREKAIIHKNINASESHKNGVFDSNIDERVRKSIRHIERSNQEVVKRRTNTRKYYK